MENYFFGYGSLVNAATHSHTPLYPARASGWRRAWVAVAQRDLCYLTAVADPAATLDGAIAPVPGNDWAALDRREAAYARHDATPCITHDSPAASIALYAVAPDRQLQPGPDNPILLSYLDTVIAGFVTLYGPRGAQDFFATTSGWQAPVLDDRTAPRYPRSTPPTQEIAALVNDGLAMHNSRILPG